MTDWSSKRFVLTTTLLTLLATAGCKLDPTPAVTITPGSHCIVLEPGASPSEVHAAEDLQSYLDACMDWEIPIVDDPALATGPMIVLGLGPTARDLGVDPDPGSLGEQGFVLRTVPPHIVIAGTPEVGTLYGAHRFLEAFLGVRWIAPGVTETPPAAEILVPATDRLVTPAFQWRNTSYNWPGKDDDFLVRVGDNDGTKGPESPYGIEEAHDGRCHSYFRFVSPGEFFDDHPEYFSEIGGVRVREETQLCLTNPEVLDIVTERMLARMADMPGHRQHNFSQMDYYNYCTCASCTAMNERYGTTGGTQFWFVNQLAERTSAVYPDKLIGTLAYMYTEEPPVDLEIHPNVAVWLCHMYPSCDSHPIATCPVNADYKRRALAWSELTGHLYIWHYVTNFMHYYEPFPNFRAMAADMRFYRDIGVEGVFLQGMGHGGGGGEFSLLRPYYGMKLLWDPDQDPEALRRDFLEGYYGDAWEPIENYIELLHDKVTDDDVHMHLYTNPAVGYLPDDIVARGEALFDEAEGRVQEDPELHERVRVARMPLVYARMFPRNGYEIRWGRLRWKGEIAGLRELFEFLGRMEDHGFQVVREVEGDPLTLLLADLILQLRPKVETIKNDHLRVDVVPLLAGRALRIIDRRTRQTVTAFNVKDSLYFPFCGGLENRVGDIHYYTGWVEPARVTAQTDTSITTEANTFDGFALTRTLTLEPGEPVLHVASTVTNTETQTKTTVFRGHLELDLGNLRETRVRFTNRAGETVDEDMAGVIAGQREGEHYYALDAPDGEWAFSGTKGLEVTHRFDNEEIDFTWLYAYPETLGEVELEIWSPRRTLAPGESATMTQELEVRPVE